MAVGNGRMLVGTGRRRKGTRVYVNRETNGRRCIFELDWIGRTDWRLEVYGLGVLVKGVCMGVCRGVSRAAIWGSTAPRAVRLNES